MNSKFLKFLFTLTVIINTNIAFSSNTFSIIETHVIIPQNEIKVIDLIGNKVNFVELKNGQIYYGEELKILNPNEIAISMNTASGGGGVISSRNHLIKL